MRLKHFFICLLTCAALTSVRAADPTNLPFLSPIFGDDMVLQRGKPIRFWGWTKPGESVRVEMAGHTASAVAGSDGRWLAELNPPATGGPYTVHISSPEQHVTLHEVLVGDVWLCGGQSNMEMGLGLVRNGSEEIKSADHPEIRLFIVAKRVAWSPAAVPEGSWKICTPQTVGENGWSGFSAVGYFFGRKLQNELHVPIGLIEDCWGGTPAESWMSPQSLRQLKDFDAQMAEIDKLSAEGLPPTFKGWPSTPMILYQAMIEPVAPFSLRGAIWYQGESNADRAHQYRTLLPLMIGDWRSLFRQGDFPFYIVSLAAFEPRRDQPGDDAWAELREAQALTAKKVKNSGLALAIDSGNATDIHPKDKQIVGDRLAFCALANEYGEKIPFAGPTFVSFTHLPGALKLRFNHTDGGLVVKGEKLGEFSVAGKDHQWHWADARIEGDSVIVSSPAVPDPEAARYAWQANPAATLYNGAGLPAVPFRTDQWPGVTERH